MRRPGFLNAIALFSLLLSFLNIIWIVVVSVIAAAFGLASLMLGPVVGLLGIALVVFFVLVMIVQSFLSVILFVAGWKTWGGDPGGRSLHLAWAWITVILDLVDLAFTAGMDGAAWLRLIYAIAVILVMNRDDVRAYFSRSRFESSFAKPFARDDWS